MVQIREHKHERLTRDLAAAVLVRASLPADVITMTTMIMLVARLKEAAP
jgi:hypothetical protein